MIRCGSCGEDVCGTDEVYERHLLRERKPVTDANPLLVEPELFVDAGFELREYYCPGCATLIETQVVREGRGLLRDKSVETDGE